MSFLLISVQLLDSPGNTGDYFSYIYICYTLAPDKNENLLSNSSPFQLMQHQRNVGLLSNTYVLQSIIGHWLLVSYSTIVWKHLHSLCVSTHFYQVFASWSDSSKRDLGLRVSPCMLKVFWEWFERKASGTFSDRKQVSGDVTVTKVEFSERRQEGHGARKGDERRAQKCEHDHEGWSSFLRFQQPAHTTNSVKSEGLLRMSTPTCFLYDSAHEFQSDANKFLSKSLISDLTL